MELETVSICTEGVLADIYEVLVEVGEGTTCREVITQLAEAYQLPSRKGAWLLQEEWQGCSKFARSLHIAD